MPVLKKILLICFCVGLCTFARSQNTINAGFRGGVNFSNLTKIKFTHEHKLGYYLGFFIRTRTSDFYAMQYELNYSRQGAKSRFNSYISHYEGYTIYHEVEDIKINHTNFQFTSQFFLGDRFYALLSPSLDLEIKDFLNDDIGTEDGAPPIFAMVKGADLSMAIGAGFDFPFGVGIEFRYKQGFLNQVTFSSSDNNLENKSLNYMMQIGITYKFGKEHQIETNN